MENHIKIPVRDCLGEERNSKKCLRDRSLHLVQHLRKTQCSASVIYKLALGNKQDYNGRWRPNNIYLRFSHHSYSFVCIQTTSWMRMNWDPSWKNTSPFTMTIGKKPKYCSHLFSSDLHILFGFYILLPSSSLEQFSPSSCFCFTGIFPIKVFFPTLILINTW